MKLNKSTIAVKTYLDGKETRPLGTPIVQSTIHQFSSSEELGNHFKSRNDDV